MKYFYGVLVSIFGLSLALSIAFAKDKPSSPAPAKVRQEEKKPLSSCERDKKKAGNEKAVRGSCSKAGPKQVAQS